MNAVYDMGLTDLLLSQLPDWRVCRNLGGICWHGAVAVLLQQVKSPVQEVAYVIGQSGIDNVPEPLL